MTICRWENGVHDIKSNDLIKVALFFGVSTDYLVGLED
ncbi:MAG: helix-turn-helix transcriptional regulator [Clostridia bacterium]|nr:helix-turn-helix transcriptional regulator [Clostridia bacterium]